MLFFVRRAAVCGLALAAALVTGSIIVTRPEPPSFVGTWQQQEPFGDERVEVRADGSWENRSQVGEWRADGGGRFITFHIDGRAARYQLQEDTLVIVQSGVAQTRLPPSTWMRVR